MNVDRYTKAVLTVIAGCLLWICAMGVPGAVQAQQTTRELGPWSDRVQPVVIVGTGSMDSQGKVVVNFTQEGRVQRTNPTLPVVLPYSPANPMPSQLFHTAAAPLPVEITGVKKPKTGDWEPIRVQVEPEPMRSRPGGGGR